MVHGLGVGRSGHDFIWKSPEPAVPWQTRSIVSMKSFVNHWLCGWMQLLVAVCCSSTWVQRVCVTRRSCKVQLYGIG